MFIVFEWVDGSGKDTQLERTISYLRKKNKNIQIWTTKEPTSNTPSGKLILEKLKGEGFSSPYEALDLYVKDREEQSVIRAEIKKHSTILWTRFDYSTYAYQGMMGLTFEEVYQAHDYSKMVIPDITFLLDISEENILKRLESRGGHKEVFENINFLTQVRNKYLEVVDKLSSQRNIVIIDANGTIDEVFALIQTELDKYF